MQGVNNGWVYMESIRSTWINKNTVLNQNPFYILSDLISIFDMFYNLYINFYNIFTDKVIMGIPNTVVTMIADSQYQPVLKQNFNNKMSAITFLAGSIPGSTC